MTSGKTNCLFWIQIDYIGKEYKTLKSEKPATKSTEKRHKVMNQPDKTVTFADKSSNMYRLTKEHQHQHMKKTQQHQEKNWHSRKTNYGKCRQVNIRPNGPFEYLIYYLAQGYIDIASKDTEIIYHVHKLLLFDEKDAWIKKQSSLFDVTMGAYDDSEVWELVGIYMLSLIPEKYNKKDFELYRDDELGVVRNKRGQETAKIKKNIRQIFKENKFYIVIQCKMKIVNYFDVSLS